MSMNTTVYVGPYLEVDGVDDGTIESFDSIVFNGQGESTDWESSKRFLIPNRPFGNPYRPMSFDKYDSPAVIEVTYPEAEKQIFARAADKFIKHVVDSGRQCNMRWGVVVGVF